MATEPAFVLATGFECSAPRIAGGGRHDQLRRLGHWTRYREDAALVRRLGLGYLRFGIPFHVVARDAGRHDWAWVDDALRAVRDEGIEPIVDLLHFGVPDDLAGVSDPRLHARYLGYVEAFLRRYPWVRWYTPVNEPFVTALLSAKRGWWNERATDDVTFARAVGQLARCAVEATARIRGARPDAIILHNDGCEGYRPAEPAAAPVATFLEEQHRAALDLVFGRAPGPAVAAWLASGGLAEAGIVRLIDQVPSDGLVVGLDHYEGNERIVGADGSVSPDPDPRGFAALARERHLRYRRPIWLAETNAWEPVAVEWLAREWAECLALLAEGVPISGFCWYSLTDQIDWDVCLREDRGRVNPLGLVDLDRRTRAVGRAFAALAGAVARGRFEPLGTPEPGPDASAAA